MRIENRTIALTLTGFSLALNPSRLCPHYTYMKFSFFFLILLAYLLFLLATESNPYVYILIWPAINMCVMAIAYIFNKPSLILGKKEDGSINIFLLALNLPWLIFTWLIFKLQIWLSKERFSDNISGTKIWLSRRPTDKDDLTSFDTIIDLTCEFVKDKTDKNYQCYPNLDGNILKNLPNLRKINLEHNILIHCANGHGRSALFASILLKQIGIEESTQSALKKIIQSRALAKPNKSQKKWLLTTGDGVKF